MKIKITNTKGLLSMRTFRIALAIIGVIIVLFNDTFGKLEGFIEFLSLYFIVVGIAIIHWVFISIRSIINLKNEKAKTELMQLQSQVNPHFFFNMLNNLYGLVDKDKDKAKMLILKLSDMMRYSIYEGQKEFVPLKDEIDFIKNYIELHRMRYHKKIDINYDIDVDNDNLKILPLLFIILVENAFKHGVEVLRDNAFVDIQLTSHQNQLYLTIKNNFDVSEKSKSGIGLSNLHRRLELVYPNRHEIVHHIDNDIYTVTLKLKL